MEAEIQYSPIWEYKKGTIIKEEIDFVTVRIKDGRMSYDLRLPRAMVKTSMVVAQA